MQPEPSVTKHDLRTYLAQVGATLTLDPGAGTITVDTDLPPELVDQLRELKPRILGSLGVPKLDSPPGPAMPTVGPGACIPAGHGLPWTGEVRKWTSYRFPLGDGRVALGHWTGSHWRWSVWPNGPESRMSPEEFGWVLAEWGHVPPVYPAEPE